MAAEPTTETQRTTLTDFLSVPPRWETLTWTRSTVKDHKYAFYDGQQVHLRTPSGSHVTAHLTDHTPGEWKEFTAHIPAREETVTFSGPSDHADTTYRITAYEPFAALDTATQRHILWRLSRDIPFKYANHSHHGKMRRFLAGGVVARCRAPAILFPTFPRIREFRQQKGRPHCEYFGRESKLYVDFGVRHASSDFGVQEGVVSHELFHATLRANYIDMSDDAFIRDGRTDRAWYYNGGFPNWDFGGEDVPAETYLLRKTDSTGETHIIGEGVLDEMLDKRLAAYEEDGLYEGSDNVHALDGRPDPFAPETDVPAAESDSDALRRLVREANIAWYTTAKAFSQGYEEVARHSFFWDEYTATNPEEFLCKLHEFLQKPGAYAGTTATLMQARHRHPWLLKRYLDVYEPHPSKAKLITTIE